MAQVQMQPAKIALPVRASIPKKINDGAQRFTAAPRGIAWDLNNPLADILKKYTGGARIAAIATLVAGTPLEELAHLLDLAAACPQTEMRQLIADLVYAKWVATDPHGALAYALAIATQSNKPDALNSVFAAWAGVDPQAALDAAQQLAQHSFRNDEMTVVLSNWVQSGDPAAALAALRQIVHGQIGGPMSRVLFDQWSKIDPAAAWAALDQVDYLIDRNAIRNLLVANMAANDPQGAFDLLHSSPPSSTNTGVNAYNQLFQQWAEQDPSAALAAVGQISATNEQTTAVKSIFQVWGQSDPLTALQTAQSMPDGDLRDDAIQLSLDGLATQDPNAAGSYIAKMPEGNPRDALILSILPAWAASDPAGALAWLNQNATGPTYDQALDAVLEQLGKSDPNAALAVITQLPAGAARNTDLQTTIINWASSDPSAAISWAESNLNDFDQGIALAGVATSLINSNPAAAADLLNQMPDSPARDSAITSLAKAWVAVDLGAATQWLQNLPADLPPAAQVAAYQSIVAPWAARDPASAAAFVQVNAANPDMEPVIALVIGAWAASDSSAALAWSVSLGSAGDLSTALESASNNIQDTSIRNSTVSGIFNLLKQTDPAAAAALAPGLIQNAGK